MSMNAASTNHNMAIPKKPEKKEDNPFVEMMKLIRKLAMPMDHQGKTFCSNNARMAVKLIFNINFKLFIFVLLRPVKKLFDHSVHQVIA